MKELFGYNDFFSYTFHLEKARGEQKKHPKNGCQYINLLQLLRYLIVLKTILR